MTDRSVEPLDTDAIRMDYEHRPWHPAGQLILHMADEIDALRARLAEVEAERDAVRSALADNEQAWTTCNRQRTEAQEQVRAATGSVEYWKEQAEAAEARLAAVEAELADPGTRLGMVNHVHARLLAAARGEADQ